MIWIVFFYANRLSYGFFCFISDSQLVDMDMPRHVLTGLGRGWGGVMIEKTSLL